MSYSHTQRRKTIRRYKKLYGKEWYKPFREYVAELVKKQLGPPIGTLADILGIENYDCPIHGKQDGPDCPRC